MKKEYGVLKKTAFLSLMTALICLLALTAATYAWFTSNQLVSTSRVEARTGTSDVRLEISSTGGADFHPAEAANLVQINKADLNWLYPVSTADLKTFLHNPTTVEGLATQFVPVQNGEYYYHGRVYLRATAENLSTESKLAVYFDESTTAGGVLAQNDSSSRGLLLNAARLGLVFENSTRIFYLSDSANEASDQARNTLLNGRILPDGQVLTMRGGEVTAVADPARSLADATITVDTSGAKLPAAPLFEMELNRVYPVDVYFYLEGCDPDCSDSISLEGVSLHLALFGVLQ